MKYDEMMDNFLNDACEMLGSIDKIADDRLEYGYDSICLRIEALASELAILKAKTSDGHRGDIDYWRRYYGNRAIRIYQILDDLLDGRGHSSRERTEAKTHGIDH